MLVPGQVVDVEVQTSYGVRGILYPRDLMRRFVLLV